MNRDHKRSVGLKLRSGLPHSGDDSQTSTVQVHQEFCHLCNCYGHLYEDLLFHETFPIAYKMWTTAGQIAMHLLALKDSLPFIIHFLLHFAGLKTDHGSIGTSWSEAKDQDLAENIVDKRSIPDV